MYESMYNYVEADFYLPWFLMFLSGLSLAFFPFFDVAHLSCFILGKTNNRMMRGGNSSHACEDIPVRRSVRQAGHFPKPYSPPPSPLPHPPSTEQIMRIF